MWWSLLWPDGGREMPGRGSLWEQAIPALTLRRAAEGASHGAYPPSSIHCSCPSHPCPSHWGMGHPSQAPEGSQLCFLPDPPNQRIPPSWIYFPNLHRKNNRLKYKIVYMHIPLCHRPAPESSALLWNILKAKEMWLRCLGLKLKKQTETCGFPLGRIQRWLFPSFLSKWIWKMKSWIKGVFGKVEIYLKQVQTPTWR